MYLGIDLGTSNSAIVGNSASELKLFKTAEGTDTLPSVIYIDKRGHKFIGVRAYDKATLSPENVTQGFKRLMGTSSPISFAASHLEMSPEECSAEIIRTLLSQARTEGNDLEPIGVVVTIPAAFNQMQNEATIRAANLAGLERVGLLQEPIAAAMASMAGAKNKNGQFMVYDLGGGTFDVALVQSISGSVNVVAHEGINMFGARDFDRMLVNELVRPWLMENFSLPNEFQTDPRYRRIIGIARHAAEKAKIALSSAETAIIFASDEEVRVSDGDGKDIYLSIEVSRNDLDRLITEPLNASISLCRKILKDNGYNNEDIDRLVLIGGPSKMPWIRTRVPHELGIPADLQTDPMTAVAFGAAIFAESREWGEGATRRKSSRASTTTKGPIQIRYDFPARTSDDRAKIRAKLPGSSVGGGYSLKIDASDGWTSGLVDLNNDVGIDVSVPKRGENRFRIIVYDPSGSPVSEASTDVVIFRTYASAGGIPATYTLAVKVVESASGHERNELAEMVAKGTLLPANGSKPFRTAKELRGGQPGQIDIEFFQKKDGVPEPELNLFLGAFRLDAETDLDTNQIIRKGDEITVHWELDDNGLLKCAVELSLLSLTFDQRNFYAPNVGHQNFEGNDGEALAAAVLVDAERDLLELKNTLGAEVETDVHRLQEQLQRQRETLSQAIDADTRRSVTEEARAARQAISIIRHAPENRSTVLERELASAQESFNQSVRMDADPAAANRFDQVAITVVQAIRNGDLQEAERALKEMEGILHSELGRSPAFLLYVFNSLASERYMAVDKPQHDRLILEGESMVAANDVEGLRRVIADILGNRFLMASGDKVVTRMASIMRR